MLISYQKSKIIMPICKLRYIKMLLIYFSNKDLLKQCQNIIIFGIFMVKSHDALTNGSQSLQHCE